MPQYELPEMYAPEFKALDSFTQGYIQALFFTNQSCIPMVDFHSEESQELIREGQADGDLPNDAGFLDIHPDALADIIAECKAFQAQNEDLLDRATDSEGYSSESAGMDFWYTRNGHGTGFWDRDLAEWIAEGLTDAARSWGECNPWFSETDGADSYTGYGFVYHN